MEHLNQAEESIKNLEKNAVHYVLAHAYYIYFLLFLVGFFLDLLFPIKIFNTSFMVPIGLVFMVLGSLLIIWAQKTTQDLRNVDKTKVEHFCHGPYCYTRSPTHLGLFFLTFGFGIVINAFFITVSALVTFLANRQTLLKKQESILAEKYGEPYLEYKKVVKF
ncbi:hypothetical protein HZA26_04380 [Candidatus Nomurabacteria bacterium]|nr:hypothetical protein [Candidatus Nomurabacteria bacterium]